MKLGAMLTQVVGSLFQQPNTQRYPFERHAPPARLRGALHYDPEKCTGCCLCVKDCPAQAIELVTLDKKAKRFVLRYHADRCTFCAQCVQSCRFKCLDMSPEEWELAALHKEPFEITYGDEADVKLVLAGLVGADPEPPEED